MSDYSHPLFARATYTASRNASSRVYHVHGAHWLRTGRGFCGRDIGRAGFTTGACDSTEIMLGRIYGAGYELCRDCERKLGGLAPLPRVETIREVRDGDRAERPIGETYGFLPKGRKGNVCEIFAGGRIARVRWDSGYTSDIGAIVLGPIPGPDGVTRSHDAGTFGAPIVEN